MGEIQKVYTQKEVDDLLQEEREKVAREIILGGRSEEEFGKDEIWLDINWFLEMKKKYLSKKGEKK